MENQIYYGIYFLNDEDFEFLIRVYETKRGAIKQLKVMKEDYGDNCWISTVEIYK